MVLNFIDEGNHQMKKKPAIATPAPPDHEMTRSERAIFEEVGRRIVANPTPRLKVSENQVSVDHPDRFVGDMLLMKALGTCNSDFKNGILRQLANVHEREEKEAGVNFCMSIVAGIEPRDQTETMLATLMAVTYEAAMNSAAYLARAETYLDLDNAQRMLNKLVRSFTDLTNSLKAYRSKAEQPVTVQNVSVSEGSQAMIVGNTQHAPHQTASSMPAITDAWTAPMPILDAQEVQPVPLRRKSGS
jgi:hypothetical protein